jgi:prepilin-type processing-associated H-X9-DG protein
VLILPYIDQQALYQQFHLDESWDSEHNKKLIEKMPALYGYPGVDQKVAVGETCYQTVRGDKTAFPGKDGIDFAQITDGTSNTIMVVEARNSVIWTKPDDYRYDEKNPGAGLLFAPRGICNVLFCDGHVETIPASTSAKRLNALFTRNGGEPADIESIEEDSGAAATDAAMPVPRKSSKTAEKKSEPLEN